MKQYFKTFGLLCLLIASMPCQAQVITEDAKELAQLGTQVYNESKGLFEAIRSLEQTTKRVVDLGAYMDKLFDISFLIPKPKMSPDVVNAVPKASKNSSLPGAADTAAATASSVVGGDSSSPKFENSSKVKASVGNNMQVTDASGTSSDGIDVQKTVSELTGGDVDTGAKTEEVSRKRAQLSKSKQAFARYALATALVHRTLAHRTFEDTKDDTSKQTAKTTTIRSAHTGKSVGNMALSETFNRLLMSQAAANGLSAFSAMDDMESKIDFNLRGITDNLANSVSGTGMGALGGLLGQ